MTKRIELNWKVDGFINEQRYYCSENPIDPENLPPPKAVLNGSVRSYVDADIEIKKTYYVVLSAIFNGAEKISSEVLIDTNNLLVNLPLTNNLDDYGSLGLNWINNGGITFSEDGAYFNAYPQSLTQNTHAFNFNQDYKISFEFKRTASNNTYPSLLNNDISGTWVGSPFGLTLAGDDAAAQYQNFLLVAIANKYDRPASILISNNVYHTVELTKISNFVTLSIDNDSVLSFMETETSDVNAFLRIGQAPHHASNGQFKGFIRNFKIYDLSM